MEKQSHQTGPARRNGLILILVLLGLSVLLARMIRSWREYNEKQVSEQKPEISFFSFVNSRQFLQSAVDNMESSFWQMIFFAALAGYMQQKEASESSAESEPGKNTEKDDPQNTAPGATSH